MLKIGQRFYDERNGRYLTITGVGANPKVYDCVQEEFDEENVDIRSPNNQLNRSIIIREARKEKDLAWIKALGYNDIPIELLNENLCQMRIIFNTIPYQILNKDRLIYLKNDSVIIDLASKPYGVDFEACKKLNINAILYSRNPRKNCI